MIEPFVERQSAGGRISFGLSSYGYDAPVAPDLSCSPIWNRRWFTPKTLTRQLCRSPNRCVHDSAQQFALARTVEYFRIPRDVLVICSGNIDLCPLWRYR
jgi:dCTP deaminase